MNGDEFENGAGLLVLLLVALLPPLAGASVAGSGERVGAGMGRY